MMKILVYPSLNTHKIPLDHNKNLFKLRYKICGKNKGI